MNGTFVEAQQGFAVLADVDDDTFVAFANFMYRGDYDLPSPTVPDCQLSTAAAEPIDQASKLKKTWLRMQQKPWDQTWNDHWVRFTKEPAYGGGSDPKSIPLLNARMDEDYSEVFISQAKMFIFADCYGIEALINHSMHKLHQALCGFRLSRARVPDILALVRFCYDNLAPEKLRGLVAFYLACIVELVSEIGSFNELLKENGDFAADLACAMVCRLKSISSM